MLDHRGQGPRSIQFLCVCDLVPELEQGSLLLPVRRMQSMLPRGHEERGGALQIGHERLLDRDQFERRLAYPRGQGGAIQINALAAVDLRLPIERQVVRIF
jgi:hypothetical protein